MFRISKLVSKLSMSIRIHVRHFRTSMNARSALISGTRLQSFAGYDDLPFPHHQQYVRWRDGEQGRAPIELMMPFC